MIKETGTGRYLSVASFRGLSTDSKPTNVDNGAEFLEIDTGDIYLFNEANHTWVKCAMYKPTDAQAEEYIGAWLDDHPEATTTVEDGAITTAKLADGAVTAAKIAEGVVVNSVNGQTGAVTGIAEESELYYVGEDVQIQTVSQASSWKVNQPFGTIFVDETDAPIFTGTYNIIDLFGLAQGTFTDTNTGVTIEIDGNEVYMHGSPTGGFRFDFQKGEFYTDAFTNHRGDIDIFPANDGGYIFSFQPKPGYAMPTTVYSACLGKAGTSINAVQLAGKVNEFYKNDPYFAFYSNAAINNLDVKFTVGLKLKNISGTIIPIDNVANTPYDTKIITEKGFYPLGKFTWTGDSTTYVVKRAARVDTNFTSDHVYAWFGDSLSQLLELPNLVANLLATRIYDCSFAGSPLTYGDPTKYQDTGFMSLCSQIVAGDFDPLEDALDAQEAASIDVTEKRVHLATLQSLDFDTVTDIVVFAGTNDFNNDYVNATNFKSGFESALTTLLTAYPHLMVYVIAPSYRTSNTGGKETLPTMEDIVDIEAEVAKEFCLPFYDLYHEGGINALTASVYLQNDGLHPTNKGDALLANKCSKFIQSK